MIRWCLVYFPSLLSCIFPFDLMIRFVGQAGPSPWLLAPILEMNNDKGKAYKNTQKKNKEKKNRNCANCPITKFTAPISKQSYHLFDVLSSGANHLS